MKYLQRQLILAGDYGGNFITTACIS